MNICSYVCSGDVVGIKFENFNLSRQMIKNLDLIVEGATPLECFKYMNGYVDDNDDIINWDSFMDLDIFVEFLKSVEKSSLRINKEYFLRPLKRKNLNSIVNNFNLSTYWGSSSLNGVKAIVKSSGDIAGLIKYNRDYDGFTNISMIEVIDKGLGLGRKVVTDLLKISKDGVEGVSFDSAIGFWKKLGADFISENRFIINKEI